jgi:hypothetical protein
MPCPVRIRGDRAGLRRDRRAGGLAGSGCQRDQVPTIFRAEKAAANHAPSESSDPQKARNFSRLFNESGYSCLTLGLGTMQSVGLGGHDGTVVPPSHARDFADTTCKNAGLAMLILPST